MLDIDKELPQEKLEILRDCIRRRKNGEPVAYITGQRGFYENIFKVNVIGIMLCCKSFAKHMFENGYGKMVILSSTRDCVATKGPGNAGYAASKGAVKMLIKQLASEFGPHGITVNGIGPTVSYNFSRMEAEAGSLKLKVFSFTCVTNELR